MDVKANQTEKQWVEYMKKKYYNLLTLVKFLGLYKDLELYMVEVADHSLSQQKEEDLPRDV